MFPLVWLPLGHVCFSRLLHSLKITNTCNLLKKIFRLVLFFSSYSLLSYLVLVFCRYLLTQWAQQTSMRRNSQSCFQVLRWQWGQRLTPSFPSSVQPVSVRRLVTISQFDLLFLSFCSHFWLFISPILPPEGQWSYKLICENFSPINMDASYFYYWLVNWLFSQQIILSMNCPRDLKDACHNFPEP